jgi:hypothetical protein
LPPVLFTLTQIVLLLITSTFTRVQIQSNLGTTVRGTRENNSLSENLCNFQTFESLLILILTTEYLYEGPEGVKWELGLIYF